MEEEFSLVVESAVGEDEDDMFSDDAVISSVEDAPIEERLKPSSTLHQEILSRLISRRDAADSHMSGRRSDWKEVNNSVRMYVDLRKGAKKGDKTTDPDVYEMPFQRSIVVPASYSILHVIVTQLVSIFGQTEPMIQIRGRGPDNIARAKTMESVLAYDLDEMRAFLPVYSLCQDATKLGCGIIYDSWHTEQGVRETEDPPPPGYGVDPFVTSVWDSTGPHITEEPYTIKEHNQWTPINPMDYYPDPRVPIGDPEEGEYCGHRFVRGLMFLKERSIDYGGRYFNIEELKKRCGSASFREDSKLSDADEDFSDENVDELDYGSFELYHMQVKLIPREWELSDGERPEIWWFTWANDSVIIRAHKNPFGHGEFTYAIAESDPDFYSAFSPGIIESISGLQKFMDWMLNSHLQNLMRHLNDALIYSPTLVEEFDITHPGPARHIRLTQLGEELLLTGGYSISNFIHQLPVQDLTSPHLSAMHQLFQLAQRLSAANDPQMGMPTPDRRTLGEIQTINANASQRIAIIARLIDSMAISKLAKRAIANRIEFTDTEQYYRIVGEDPMSPNSYLLANRDSIAGNYDYVYNSGILPPDPVRMSRTWAQILETAARTVPMIMQSPTPPPDGKIPDINRILKETISTMGVKNLDEFLLTLPPPQQPGQPPQVETTVMPDEQVQQQVQ